MTTGGGRETGRDRAGQSRGQPRCLDPPPLSPMTMTARMRLEVRSLERMTGAGEASPGQRDGNEMLSPRPLEDLRSRM